MTGNGVKVYLNQKWLVIFRPFGGGAGFTFGHRIFLYDKVVEPGLLAHEEVHVKQYVQYGVVGFLARYLWGLICLRDRSIDKHPLEKPAYEAQKEVNG